MRIAAVAILLLATALPLWGGESELVIDDFEHGLRAQWEARSFKGQTSYTVVPDQGGGHCLRAEAAGSASGLVFEKEFDLREFPILSWRWKVENTLSGGDARRKSGDDYPARVYVIFPHWFPPKSRSINYIWANRLPKGKWLPNSYFANAIMVALQSGNELAGSWVEQRVNVYEDFRRLFGQEPPLVGAIAIMSDSDQTGEKALACYDDIRIGRD